MASVEEDFPRGGTTKKPTESKIVVQRTEVDNLFQVDFHSCLSNHTTVKRLTIVRTVYKCWENTLFLYTFTGSMKCPP